MSITPPPPSSLYIDVVILEYKAASIVIKIGKIMKQSYFHIANMNDIQAYSIKYSA